MFKNIECDFTKTLDSLLQAPMATTTTLKENKKRVNNYEQIKE